MTKLKVLDLFSGIGGFSLGLERTGGFETIAFCDVDQACHKVLNKHWKNIPIFDDVKTLTKEKINETVDVICGGFPCQDISLAGKGKGIEGERSGLWFEFHRLIKETKPKFIIAENVAALRSRGLEQVLHSLNEIGYCAEWHCIPASFVGAFHRRDRIWIVAYPYSEHVEGSMPKPILGQSALQRIYNDGKITPFRRLSSIREPRLHRTFNGLPGQVDRLKQLGNAVVPQIPELIGQAILARHSLH